MLRIRPQHSLVCLTLLLPGAASNAQAAPERFVRGDADGDGRLTLADAAGMLRFLFRTGTGAACLDALDVDDSGVLDLSDGVLALRFLYTGGMPPPPPYPACGADPTPDPLGCGSHAACDAATPGQVSGDPLLRAAAGGSGEAAILAAGSRSLEGGAEGPGEASVEHALVTGRESTALPGSRLRGSGGAASELIAIGETVDGEIRSVSQVDRHTFTAAPGQWIVADRIAAANPFDHHWQIEDAWGRVLASHASQLTDLGPIQAAGGDYTLTITPDGSVLGSYSFRIVDAAPLAAPLTFGQMIQGASDPDHPGRLIFHDFTVPAGGRRVMLDIPASTAPSWELANSEGRVIVPVRQLFRFFGPITLAAGNYRMTIRNPVSQGNFIAYSYTCRWVEVPAPVTAAIAIGQTVPGEIATPGEEDIFTFTASAGQSVFLDALVVSNAGGMGWRLLDAEDREIKTITGILSDAGPFTLAGGEYSLRIAGDDERIGTYQFRILDATAAAPVPIAIGADTAGAVPADRLGQPQRYTFNAPAGKRLTIETVQTSNNPGLDWLLEDSFGRVVLARTGSLATVSAIDLLGGAYRLSVIPEGGSAGTFTFRLRDDGAAAFTPAGEAAAISQEIAGAIPAPGGNQAYIFTATAGASVFLDLIEGNTDLDWDFIDPAGRIIETRRANSVDSSDLGPVALAAGTYTVLMRARTATAAPPFRFKISSAPVVERDAAPGETIAGDFTGTAGAIHRFHMALPQARRILLDRLTAAPHLNWTLRDPAGQDVFALATADGFTNDQGPFDLAAGIYTLDLDPESGYQPPYDFRILAVEDRESAYTLGQTAHVDFTGRAGSIESLRFDAAQGQKLFFYKTSLAGSLRWTLLDPAGGTVFGPEYAESNGFNRGPITLTVGGTYKMVFDPDTGFEPVFDFQALETAGTDAPLPMGTPVAGSLAIGAVAAYSFDAPDGMRIFFDLLTGASSLTWSLLDERNLAVFQDQRAFVATDDRGPMNLARGRYRLVLDASGINAPSYSFTAQSLDVDLAFEEIDASPRVIFAGDALRQTAVTYRVKNLGAGPQAAGPAVDRIILSRDATLGNADDRPLGDFLRFEPLAPHGSYGRTATVSIPEGMALGSYRLFVLLDAGNALVEPGGKANNNAAVEVQLIEDLPPAQPGFIATTTFPISFVTSPGNLTYDVPLAQTVQLDSIRHIFAGVLSVRLERIGGGLGLDSSATLSLLSGGEEILEIASRGHGGGGAVTTLALRFERRLTAQVVALLPRRAVDGLRIRFDQPNTTRATISSINTDGKLRVDFASCEFMPCGPHEEPAVTGVLPITHSGGGVSPWTVVNFPASVSGDGLRLVSGPRFTGDFSSFFGIGTAASEAQLILDNGQLLTLDDWSAPSSLGSPSRISADHSLHLDGHQLDGRRILGFQFRVHGGPNAGTSVVTPLDPLTVRFLYDTVSCSGSIAIPPMEIDPPDGSVFAPDTTVVISGRAFTPQPGRPISAVLVNGEAADSLDGAGRFFKTVPIAAGDNLFVVEVVEPGCGQYQALLHLQGVTDGTSGLAGYAEATADLSLEYAETTFVRAASTLLVKARVRNASDHAVRGPILLAFPNLRPAAAELRAAAGLTDRGEPYTVLLEGGVLAPGEAGPYTQLSFYNPAKQPLRYDIRWLALANRPPYFRSSPAVRAASGEVYRYNPSAADPDGDALHFSLASGPAGMSLDAGTGALAWTPGPADIGAHDVSLSVDDGLGGRASQRWTLTVGEASPNRPPFFATSPSTGAAVGSPYLYEAAAVDPDGEPVAYSLLSGPDGLTIDAASGRVSWAYTLPGEHTVSIRAADAAGASAVQSWTLAAGSIPSNPSAPRITTSPSTEAVPGILYIYQPVAGDPDGDALEYRLETGPAGMTIAAGSGRIEWTPAIDDTGTHPVELSVRDGRGGETRQGFDILVRSADANLPPVIESVPPAFALAGALFRYDADAIDPDGGAVVFSLASGPAGMTIDAASGVVSWTPAAGQTGTQLAAIRAVDSRGAAGNQAFEIRVRAGNAAPQVLPDATPPSVIAGATWQHDLEAVDGDGDLLRYEIAGGPSAMTIQPVTGLITWNPAPLDVGVHPILIRVSDGFGGSAEKSFSIEVLADTAPPIVEIGFPTYPAPVGSPVEVWVTASDNAAIASKLLSVESAPAPTRTLTLDVLGRTTFSSAVVGYSIFTATVTDASGNKTTAVKALQVGNPDDPLDPHPPVVEILSPAPGSVITAPINVVATITDATEAGKPGSGPFSWTVELAPKGGGSFETLGSGAGAPQIATLAVFDPTRLPNGTYRLRITGNDTVQTGGIEFDVNVAGGLKMGNYTTSMTDLLLPLAGLPVVVARTYDSIDTSTGDFGAGWRLDLPGKVEDGAAEMNTGNGLVDLLGREPFSFGTRVYVTRPDGARVGFTFQPQSLGGALGFLWAPRFEPDAGVTDKLEVVEPAGHVFVVGGKASQIGVPYNPTRYRLTVEGGMSFTIDEKLGLQRIEDRIGNAIDVRPDGLFSVLGPAVRFERDAAGRISRIIEPPQNGVSSELNYLYDARGNLVASVDAGGHSTEYFYEQPEFPHHLTRIEDPLGRPWIRNAYDDQGRLIGLCGADGNPATLEGCASIDWSPDARVSTVIDSRGFRTDLIFDERGNVIIERQYLAGGEFLEITKTYDADDNLLRIQEPSGGAWTFTYDESGNETSRTDPIGRVWRSTFNSCDLPESETDPMGNTTRLTFDEYCQHTSTTDAIGNVYRFVYNDEGLLSETIDPMGSRWQFQYDSSGFVSAMIDPRGKTTAYTMNSLGKVLTLVPPDGKRIDFEYDAAHRLIRETWNTVPPRILTFEHDEAGQVTRASDPDSVLRFEYHPTGKVKTLETSGLPGLQAVSVQYEYDGNGNIIQVQDSLGGSTSYEYDGAERIASVRQSGASVNAKRADAVYSQVSVLAEIRRYADLGAASPVATTTFVEDCVACNEGWTAMLHKRASDGSLIHGIELIRDLAGVIVRMTDAEGAHIFQHDGQWRLTAVDHPGGSQPDESYTYDGAGNRLTSHLGGQHDYGYSAGAGGNDLRGDNRFEYETDAAGNISRKRDRTTGTSTEYRYDHRVRLSEVIELSSAGVELKRSTYTYDAADRRIRSVENGQTFYYFYDGQNPILVLDAAGQIRNRRMYLRALDAIIADETGGQTRWLLSDFNGSIRDVVGNDGNSIAHLVYDSFGGLRNAADAAASGDLGFMGREHSRSTGLIHVRARAYDPALGRFLQMDPLSPHQYEYADNSPAMFIDATGKHGGRQLDAWRRKQIFDRADKAFLERNPFKPSPKPLGKYEYNPLGRNARWKDHIHPSRIRSTEKSEPRGNEYAILVTGIALQILEVFLVYDGYLIGRAFASVMDKVVEAITDIK